jgi:hypothetical protein
LLHTTSKCSKDTFFVFFENFCHSHPFHQQEQQQMVTAQSEAKMAAQKTACKTSVYFMYEKLFYATFLHH